MVVWSPQCPLGTLVIVGNAIDGDRHRQQVAMEGPWNTWIGTSISARARPTSAAPTRR